MKRWSRWLVLALLALVVAVIGYEWWRSRQPLPVTPPVPPQAAAPAASEPAAAASSPEQAASEPGILHSLEPAPPTVSQAGPLPALDASDPTVTAVLTNLLGKRDVLTFLNLDGFVRRAVATVDNLGRKHAASRVWPVVPTEGRFQVTKTNAETVIAEVNSARYTPFVKFATSVDTTAAGDLYRQFYPLFQTAYEELGYPGKYFNDRLVVVIDQLLATPVPDGPVKLTLTQVQGPVPTLRPWVRYEYADPALESRPAGQKILMRMGPANAALLKQWLSGFRARIAAK
jgi:hypothetical protein